MKLWKKFLVVRRDGSIPEWPYIVLGARDPAAPTAIRMLAAESESRGMAQDYCDDLLRLADDFEAYREQNGDGDPDVGPHREDLPWVVEGLKLTRASGLPLTTD